LLTGYNTKIGRISKVYQNDGGVFTETDKEFTGVQYSSAAWGDYDDDGDLDILLSGYSGYGEYISKIYINGNTEISTVPQNVQIIFGNDNVSITWDAVSDATSYKIYSCDNPYGTFSEVTTLGVFDGLSWTITGEEENKYFYYVVAVTEDKSAAGSKLKVTK